MTISVLINCFNYADFVGEAIRSVGSQTRRADELIVVDDGSKDDSVNHAQVALTNVGFGRLIRQENQGQLAAFQAGLEAASGDWIAFLDADDIYKPRHLERLGATIAMNPEVDFIFTDVEPFGDGSGRPFRYRGPFGDLGYSTILVMASRAGRESFVGGVTSTLCIRRPILNRLFPFSRRILEDWKIRADNMLVLGSAIAGARKMHTDDRTVGYRLHGSNRFAGQRVEPARQAGERLKAERLLGELQAKVPYPQGCLSSLGIEYRGLPTKNHHIRKDYWRVAWRMDARLSLKLRVMMTMAKSEW